MLIPLVGMQGVLPEEAAARLDGLGRLAIVWRIVLPMSGRESR